MKDYPAKEHLIYQVIVSKKVQKLDENAAQFILQGALDYLTKNNT